MRSLFVSSLIRRFITISYMSLALFLLTGQICPAQNDPAAGINPFSTQVSGPVDSVDVATGNILIRIPVRTKSGGIPVSYSLVSNSHAYTYSYSSEGKTVYL